MGVVVLFCCCIECCSTSVAAFQSDSRLNADTSMTNESLFEEHRQLYLRVQQLPPAFASSEGVEINVRPYVEANLRTTQCRKPGV